MNWFGFALSVAVGFIVGWVIRDEMEARAAKRRRAIIEQSAARLEDFGPQDARTWIN